KAAVIGFTKALAKELGPSNIQVNCVAPGIIDTEMNSFLSDEEKHALIYDTPMNRFGTPEEIARCVSFLARPGANFFTGQVLSPNGGFVI
ncbi:MAG TPA: SDR family oxidoreductase, partial [Clostridia bacterium]|nr:SDR family oxidoreductase [Clostridia bacterium]